MTLKADQIELKPQLAMDYSPYGGVFWKSKYSENQRDNWVGKEKDKENGLGDHGVRKYDHLIGRFNSIDPLWGNYLDVSPYMYSANNPIFIKDVNGGNGVAVVTKQNTTITIKAVYLTVGYTSSEVISLNKEINENLNNQNFLLSSGEYEGYDVVFKLEFIRQGANDTYYDTENFNEQGINIGNKLSKVSDNHSYVEKKRRNEGVEIGGFTQRNVDIGIPKSRNNNENITHEIFHTLFFSNDDSKRGGIGTYNNIKANKPNPQDIEQLIYGGDNDSKDIPIIEKK
ncbi:hypothetical protein OAQ99_03065 [Candidatus Kapabacteria bacterium]|nr:hypothetical protein [Candidatus Kapabacteria bacterium]